jgi:hypothetical protein
MKSTIVIKRGHLIELDQIPSDAQVGDVVFVGPGGEIRQLERAMSLASGTFTAWAGQGPTLVKCEYCDSLKFVEPSQSLRCDSCGAPLKL